MRYDDAANFVRGSDPALTEAEKDAIASFFAGGAAEWITAVAGWVNQDADREIEVLQLVKKMKEARTGHSDEVAFMAATTFLGTLVLMLREWMPNGSGDEP